MDDKSINEQSWFRINWKWLIPSLAVIICCVTLLAGIDGKITDLAKAYSDSALCQAAIDKADKNERVVETLGGLQPIDKMAILEGNAVYSDDGNSVAMTVRVTGSKGKAKMDITADKVGDRWDCKSIRIRIKKTGEEIPVL